MLGWFVVKGDSGEMIHSYDCVKKIALNIPVRKIIIVEGS